MNLITLLLIALAMSTDAFAAAIGKGAALAKPKLSQAFKMGLLFGSIEAITPLIGYMIGQAASSYVEAWDHWIAFGILLVLGGHMIYEALSPDDEEETSKPTHHAWYVLILTAIGTSIDAAAVGVSFAFMDVNIWLAALLIGAATCTMVTIGVMIGRVVGNIMGHRAEMLGGLVLIAIGSWILYSHLSA